MERFVSDKVVWVMTSATDDGQLERAILRNDCQELALDITFQSWRYAGVLHWDGHEFAGTCLCRCGAEQATVPLRATLYTARNAPPLLFGSWIEDGEEYHWWAQLEKVERFEE